MLSTGKKHDKFFSKQLQDKKQMHTERFSRLRENFKWTGWEDGLIMLEDDENFIYVCLNGHGQNIHYHQDDALQEI